MAVPGGGVRRVFHVRDFACEKVCAVLLEFSISIYAIFLLTNPQRNKSLLSNFSLAICLVRDF